MPPNTMAPSELYSPYNGTIIPNGHGPQPVITPIPTADNVATINPVPSREYVSSSRPGEFESIPTPYDTLTRRMGPRIYDDMRDSDGVVDASLRTVRGSGVGTSGPSLSPRYPDPFGRPIDFRNPPSDLDPRFRDDVIHSAWCLEFASFVHSRMRISANELAWALSECCWHGSKLAEIVWGVTRDFDGLARRIPVDVRPRSWWQWAFVADRTNRIDSILCRDPEDPSRFLRIPAEKFVWASFLSDGDLPVGRSLGIAIDLFWRLKGQIPKRADQWMKVGSLPIPVLTMSATATARLPVNPDGSPNTALGAISPEAQAASTLSAIQAGKGVAVPNGANVDTVDIGGEATRFTAIGDLADRQIVHAITGTPRSSLPTERNSDSDAKSAESVSDVVRDLIGAAVSRAWHTLIERSIAENRGDSFAKDYSPGIRFGSPLRDLGKMADAGVKLGAGGFIAPSQRQSFTRQYCNIHLPEPTGAEEAPPAATDGATGRGTPPE